MKVRFATILLLAALPASAVFAQSNLGVAQYNDAGELQYPDNLVEWIQSGASVGGRYDGSEFDPKNPGVVGIVQMEPSAYRYFMENGTYADGTMFLLSFYEATSKSDPQLTGFVQGALDSQEIHVIDRSRFDDDGHAFFIFPTKETATSTRIPAGNECIACHTEHGDLDATFIQFYPDLRAKLGIGE
jgi:hypothetical protein